MRQWLAPYQRITSGRNLIPEIDGLRFVAIFWVYLYHLAGEVLKRTLVQPPPMDPVFALSGRLNIAVPLFFVISGFILGLPFATARRRAQALPRLGAYYKRRVTRLEPPYLVSLVLIFAAKLATGRGSIALVQSLFASIFYVHNIAFGRPSDVNFVAWSLEIEVQFYCLAPLLALVFAIGPTVVRRVVLCALVLLATWVSVQMPGNTGWQLSLLGYLQFFLAGFVLNEWYLSTAPRERHVAWDLVAAVAVCAIIACVGPPEAPRTWAQPWAILALMVATFRGPVTNAILTNLVVTTLGGMCYSIYLLHNYVVSATGMVTGHLGLGWTLWPRLALQGLLITPVVLVTCAAFFRLVERPCMRPDWVPRLRARLGGSRSNQNRAESLTGPAA